MLQLTIPGAELWDEKNEQYVYTKDQTLQLEHSLISLQKWESKWKKAFLSKKEKTVEETLDYIKCMTITQNVDPQIYNCLTDEQISKVLSYISDSMTATYISNDKNSKASREVVTAELIYYWMISYNIPFECRKWHLSQLLTLIQVFNVKNTPPKKRSKKDILREYSAINDARRKRLGTKG